MAVIACRVALAIGVVLVAASANAGMVCRGSVMTGFEREAQIAALALPAPTVEPAALRVYAAHTAHGYYYESNYVRPGQHSNTKIVSDTPMSPRQVVLNVMFVSNAEVAANDAATQIALAALDAATTQLASID